MSDPLDGARLKVVRAQEHLDAFKAEGGAFLDTKPYRFESEIYDKHWWVKPRIVAPPPMRLSAIIGDCLTNARAALDYILWELAQQYFDPPVDLSRWHDRKSLSFPVLSAEPKRRQPHLNHLDALAKRGIPADALLAIKNVQADVSGDESLRWLTELVNRDKHQTLILTIGAFSAAKLEFVYGARKFLAQSEIIKDGVAIRAHPDLLAAIKRGEVDVDVQAAVYITGQDVPVPHVPVDRTLEQIIETVANVVARFDGLFR
jgi:hypothetical protein